MCTRRIRFLSLPLAALMLAALSPAAAEPQVAGPALTARVAGVDSVEAQSRKLRIDSLDVRVRVHGTIAETIVTARFGNAGQQILEGDFTLAMPAGSVVTGYALDVNGRMIDGVLVDQRQAAVAYEARIRRRVDPGLAEVGRDNIFHTRVFPIAPGSGRTIRLRFTTPLDPRAGYVLPMMETDEIGAYTLAIEASGMARAPALRVAGDGSARWESDGGTHRFILNRNNVRLDGDIAIGAPQPAAPLLVSSHDNGERFFQIADSAPAPGGEAPPVRSVALLWDRSLSRAEDDLEKEIALVQLYLDRVRPQAIDLILFDSGGAERSRVRTTAELIARLRAVRYRGATSLAVLAPVPLADSDACLLFSDGLVTIDRREGFLPDCPLFAVSSARDADRAYLGALARGSGGEAYDLAVRGNEEVLSRLTRRVPRVISVRSTAGASIDFSLLEGGESGWRIVGPMPASGDIVVRLSGLASGPTERLYAASAEPVPMNGAGALWAGERAALLAASDDRNREALVNFSRHYSVASPDVSFIVLETGRDYAMAHFDPSSTLPAELREEYRRVRDEMKQQEIGQHAGRLQTVLSQWEEMRTWWANRFDAARRPRTTDERRESGQSRPVPVEATPMEAPPPPPPQTPQAPIAGAADAMAESSNIVVTGTRTPTPQNSAAAPISVVAQSEGVLARSGETNARATIALEPWAANRPYLAALDAAPAADFERVFAEQQRRHGALPAFWLDVADWAFRKGRHDEALRLLLSALDLPTRNNQTLSIVAERLMRYGQMDRAIWLLERLAAAEDDRPQPRRTLALALAKRAESAPREQARADLARALSLLTEVVMTPWNSAYDGIEMISLVEANRLIPRYRALGGETIALDPRLIALLDVDLRVTIEWNSEATDVDLWVDEPTGERAIYHNPRTAIGGRLSNDMTQGFGPEEYLLHRAPNGNYEVRANIFASDQLSPNGAQRVTAHIFRDYGRASEHEEVVDIELLPNDSSRERRVGTIRFGGPPSGAPDQH